MTTEALIKAGNSALELNEPTGLDLHITSHGSDWLWAVFSVMGVSFLYHLTMTNVSQNKKLIHGIAIIPVIFEFIAYFAMASNLGWTGTVAEFYNVKSSSGSYVRQIFYAKYIAWVFSYPAFLTFLEITANEEESIDLNSSVIVYVLNVTLSSWMFSVCLLIGALVHSTYKWGFFVFGTFGVSYSLAMLYNRIILVKTGKSSIIFISLLSGVIWLLYLVSWGLSEGGNVIQSDSELVFYGILDLFQFSFLPILICLITKAEKPYSLQLPERIIEKHTVIKQFDNSETHSGETVIHSKTPSPKPESV